MNTISLAMYAGNVIRICVLLGVGIPLVSWISNFCTIFCAKRLSQHVGVLVGRIVFYSGLVFIGVTLLHECGFNVTALLGAAGVLGVAIGFASQTSISNIISGFFLVLERPFSVGDTIKSGDMVGIVESIDLLAVRVRTVDNKLVRLPNEAVLKNNLTNLTYYPIKRIDCILSVPYADNTASTTSLVYSVIKDNSLFLTQPSPVVMVNKVAQHDYDAEVRLFTVRVWVSKDKFTSAPAVLMEQLKDAFDKAGSIITVVQIN